MSIFRDKYGWKPGTLFSIGIIAVVGIFGILINEGIQESKAWAKFSKEHNCVVVAKISGDVITTIGGDGKVAVGFTDDKTGYKCDDGVTYYR
jgi:hypothetical protein